VTAPVRYRVWCLSWEDEEEYGSDVVSYDILQPYPNADRNVVFVPDTLLHNAGDAAEAYADYAHDNRDGYDDKWPLVFRVRCPDGTTCDFEVDREFVAEFSAEPIDPLTAEEPTDAAAESESKPTEQAP
jgi:hypothetical protein